MSGEIDISLFIAALRRRWWVIVLCTVAALAAALGFSSTQAKRYEATKVLLVQSPTEQWRFDSAVISISDLRRDFQREVLAIARNNAINQAASAALQATYLEEPVTAQMLRSAVTVRAADGNTIVVTALADDPDQAALYANTWTSELINAARSVYGGSGNLAAFQTELKELDAQLQEQERVLAAARARTGLFGEGDSSAAAMQPNVNLQQLNQLTGTLAEYLTALHNLRLVQGQLAQAPPDADLAQLPWELLDGPVLGQRGVISPDIARASLDDRDRLMVLLRQEESALQVTADQLANQAEQLRSALASDWQEYADVLLQRDQARDNYQIMARKVSELLLKERVDLSPLTRLGGPEPSIAQVRSSMLGLLATATVVGLIVGVLLAVVLEMASRKTPGRQANKHA